MTGGSGEWLTSICLACRTALPRGAKCDGGKGHRVADLETLAGREAHLEEVWGPPARQRRLRALVRAGTAGSVFEMIDCDTGSPATMVVDAVLAIAIASLIECLVNAVRRRMQLRPHGGARRPPLPGGNGSWQGIAEGSPEPSPLRHEACLAYSIELRSSRARSPGHDVLWREAWTAGFSVRLQDGELLRIPAGPVRLAGVAPDAERASRARATAQLPCELSADVAGELPQLPFDEAFEEIVRPADRVAVLSRVDRREDTGLLRDSIRAPAQMVAVALDTPVIVRLP